MTKTVSELSGRMLTSLCKPFVANSTGWSISYTYRLGSGLSLDRTVSYFLEKKSPGSVLLLQTHCFSVYYTALLASVSPGPCHLVRSCALNSCWGRGWLLWAAYLSIPPEIQPHSRKYVTNCIMMMNIFLCNANAIMQTAPSNSISKCVSLEQDTLGSVILCVLRIHDKLIMRYL